MPNAHFECPACGALTLVVYRAADVGGAQWPPRCRNRVHRDGCHDLPCGYPMEMAPQPGDFAIDAKEPFQQFNVMRQQVVKGGDVVQVQETIGSVHQMRKIERDSETRFANGEGEPMRFRAWSQGRSNKDVTSFGTEGSIGGRSYDSGKAPTKKFTTTRHGQTKPTVAVARGAGHSPLSR